MIGNAPAATCPAAPPPAARSPEARAAGGGATEPAVVDLRGVGKRYGQRWALQAVELTLERGEITGFIGPNGAGKSTLIKVMAGLVRATTGHVHVLGERLDGRAPRTPDGVALVLEQAGLIPYLSGRRNLEQLARIRGVADRAAIERALATVGLDPADRRPVRAYSLGMRQRLALAQALMERPRLLLLDEPTNGLDPAGIIGLRSLLRNLAEAGTTIFLASHLLTEVERVCDRVLLVRDGRVVKHLSRPTADRTSLRVSVSSERDTALVMGWAERGDVRAWPVPAAEDHRGQPTLRPGMGVDGGPSFPAVAVETDRATPEVVRALVDAGVRIEGIDRASGGLELEREFMALVNDAQAGREEPSDGRGR